ncbi:hypothetical protein ARMSODRAFT_678501 [Armillaria solidipes]|uniref:Uncharacterized protein n=1 Tax=Armillaria solidipes TaxID=1076256 RepID=A0A2H3BB19_9AGAR|nr:hypothetical protein ARMSODRAFT_678501 [Armillaria solidipes]
MMEEDERPAIRHAKSLLEALEQELNRRLNSKPSFSSRIYTETMVYSGAVEDDPSKVTCDEREYDSNCSELHVEVEEITVYITNVTPSEKGRVKFCGGMMIRSKTKAHGSKSYTAFKPAIIRDGIHLE